MKFSPLLGIFESISYRETYLKLVLFPSSAVSFVLVILVTILLTFLYKKVHKVGANLPTKPVNLSQTTLDYFPELPCLPVIGPVYQFFEHRNGLYSKWSKECGSCFRTKIFGINVLSIQDPDLLKSMFTTKDTDHLEKQQWQYRNIFPSAIHNGLLIMPAKDWVSHRKVLNSMFTYKALNNYVGIYQKHAEKLVKALMQNYDKDLHTSGRLSYGALIHIKMLDVITEIIIGKPFEDILGASGALKAYQNLESYLNISGNPAQGFPWVFLPGLRNIHPLKRKMDKHFRDFENAIKKIIESHVPDSDTRFAMDLMIKSGWSDAEILAEILTLIATGHETVSGSLGFLLWMLAIEQEHQTACRDEIDEIFDRIELTGETMNMACFSEMKYLERCIKETLRLFPSLPVGATRELKSELTLSKGMTVNAGTVMMFSPYILHRDPKIYPDPEKFDPDRFLPENVRSRHPYAYLPFSGGVRNCIGWKAAIVELTVVSAVLLRHFQISTTDKRQDIPLKLKISISPSREPNLTFERRNKCTKLSCHS